MADERRHRQHEEHHGVAEDTHGDSDDSREGHDHPHGHQHDHGQERGWRAGWRYIGMIRKFWRSDVNTAVVDLIDPQPGERLLDVGAGMGAAAVVAADRIDRGSVTAVDPLPGMRLFANLRRIKPGRWKVLRVEHGTAEELPVADGSIDAAWATNAMHHFDDIAGAAGELARVTVPGARVVMVEEQFTDPRHPSYEKFGGDDHESHHHRFHAVDLERVADVFGAAGFEVDQASDTLVAGVPAKLVRLRRV